MNTKIRYGLSAAVLALIGAGASAPQILDQFLDEKKVTTQWHTAMVLAYGPSVGVPQWWMEKRFSQYETVEGKCDRVNAIERDKALAWVERNIKVPLTEPQKAGIASFCPYNIGPVSVFRRRFISGLMPVIVKAHARRFAGG